MKAWRNGSLKCVKKRRSRTVGNGDGVDTRRCGLAFGRSRADRRDQGVSGYRRSKTWIA